MKLSPVEILTRLGFDVPAEGVTINSADAFLHDQALRLFGGTLNVDAISEGHLRDLYYGLAFVAGSSQACAKETTPESLERLREALRFVLRKTFHRHSSTLNSSAGVR